MKIIHLFLFLLSLSLNSAEDEIISIGHREFNKISSYEGFNNTLVMFYDPKCPYSQRTLPEFRQAAKITKERNLDIVFGMVDLGSIPKLGDAANITKVPTIFLFSNGQPALEIPAHTYDEIVNFVMNFFHYHAVELHSLENATNLLLQSENVGIFYGKETDPEYLIFREYLELHEIINVAFAYVFKRSLINELELNNSSKFVLIRKSDRDNVYFTGEFSVQNLKKFVDVEVFPVVMQFQHRILQDFLKKHYPLAILIRKEDHKKSEKAQLNFHEACKGFRGKMQCVMMHDKDEMELTLMEIFGIKSENLPQVRIFKAKTNETFYKYKPLNTQMKLSPENIISFVNDYFDSKLQHYYKSEPVPPTNDGPIKKLVRDNFQEIVYDKSKDVLVFFHTTWCHHCLKAENQLKSLRNTLKNVKNLIFAEGDLTTNDFEDLEIVEVPTIYFYPSSKKESPLKFTSITSFDNLVEFLKRYVTVDKSNSILSETKSRVKEEL